MEAITRLLKIVFLVTFAGIIGRESREAARRRQIANNLTQLGLTMHDDHAKQAEAASQSELVPSAQRFCPSAHDILGALYHKSGLPAK